MKKIILIKYYVLVTIMLLAISCGGEKTEQEKYDDLTSGIKYKSYKKLSEVTVPASIKISEINNDTNKIEITPVRLMLGYFWAVSKKSQFALAESNIIEEDEKDTTLLLLNHMLKSIVLYDEGLMNMSNSEAKKAYSLISKNPNDAEAQQTIAVYHLLLGTACINEKDYKAAQFHFVGFGIATGITWPAKIVEAMGEIEGGNPQKGLIKIKELSKDKSLPSEVRIILADAIKEVEKTTGPVDSKLFWPRNIGRILFEQLKNSSSEQISKFGYLINDLSGKLSL